ncbi:MAG: MFS transporter, partial [Chloroflexota bacterium]
MEEQTYKKRINAWVMYDWANSAFATTVMAGFMPVYFAAMATESG